MLVLVLLAGATLAVLSYAVLGIAKVPSYYDEAFLVITLLIFGFVSIKLLSAAILDYGGRKVRMDEKSVSKVAELMGYSILVLLLMAEFNINITGILVGAGFLGIVIGLASQSTLGNFFAGISMMAAKPFATGDKVTFSTWQYGLMPPSYSHHQMLPGYTGTILELGMMYTRIKLEDGTSIFVPNGVLNQAVIINYTVSDKIEVKARVELGNKSSFEKFRGGMVRGIRADRKLSRLVMKSLDVKITDIGVSNYGVLVTATVPIESEKYAQTELTSIALRTVSRS